MNFSAVILAGGKSSRMGCDKAFLQMGGITLLARQIRLAREIGAADVFISGRPGTDYSSFGCRVLMDGILEAGPLAGIAQAMRVVRTPLLLVLAVDMANIQREQLHYLHGQCQSGMGVVPIAASVIEPLAAFYPQGAVPLAEQLLAEAEPSRTPGARAFAELCVQKGLARFVAAPPAATTAFRSWNVPADVSIG
ncbi:MAG TPA: molybdenum cofactor guanylyltransferase [Verrucomicrobiae bacterium]